MSERDQLMQAILNEADSNGFDLTDKAEKILNAKLRMKLGMRCPCHPDDPDSYCISPKCKAAIQLLGHCCCNLFTNGVPEHEAAD